MLVQCPKCQTTYRVAESLIATPNPTFRCSRCKHIFVLGLNTEAGSPGKITPTPPTPPRHEDEPELSFSFPQQEERKTTEEQAAEASSEPPQSEQTSAEKSDEASIPATATEEPPPSLEKTEPLPLSKEKETEESWSISDPRPQQESFIIPEEDRTLSMDSGADSDSELEGAWSDSLPLLEERESDPALDRYRDRPLSVVPYISLFGTLLLIYSLLTLMYQAQPKTIEAAIKTIPWLGPLVLKNNHLRHGITLQSLRPSFQTVQGNREVFVLSGVAVNRHPMSVREIRVEGYTFNAEGKEIDRQTVSLGNAISAKILRDLTVQEISILQKLNPQKRFEIPPDESAGFVIVFLKASSEVKSFSCRLVSAEVGV